MKPKLNSTYIKTFSCFCFLIFGTYFYLNTGSNLEPIAEHDCVHHNMISTESEQNLLAAADFERALQQQSDLFGQYYGYSHCWAPGTSDERVRAFIDQALQSAVADKLPFGNFETGSSWTATATDGAITPGDCFTLTWSIVPDGTSVNGFNGEPTAPSALIGFLDGIYGCTSTADLTQSCWFPLFVDIFDDWAAKTGISYVFSVDDGDPWTTANSSPGILGVRGDVRITGHPVDGNSGILAYNFFPAGGGDMVIDVPDNFYNDISNNSLRLRNVLSHEHGHGLGLAHSCPVNNSKLMEPFINLNFDGPQEDDILGAQSLYGDNRCMPVELITKDATVECVSIRNGAEEDVWRFTTTECQDIKVTMTPVGSTYLAGPQDGSGTGPGNCSDGTPFDAMNQANLDIMVMSGATVIGTGAANGTGQMEMVAITDLPAGTYDIIIKNNGENAIQGYELTCTGTACVDPVCTISSAGLTNIQCNDGGTPMDPSDDFITFDLNPIGNLLGTNYTVSGAAVTPTTGAYGATTSFSAPAGSAGGGDLTITLTDDTDAACTIDVTVTDPGSCAAFCELTDAGLANVTCDNNGTPTDGSDDFITFELNPTGSLLGTNYTVSGAAVTPTTGAYGGATTFSAPAGSAGGGDLVLTITDDTDGTCTIMVTVADPGSCSVLPMIPNISDPCNCFDPLNCRGRLDEITYFHDVLTVELPGVANATVTLLNDGGPGVFLAGPCPEPMAIPTPTVLGTTDAAGILEFDFYHLSGATGTITVQVGNTAPIQFTVQACNASECAVIPTMSEWGLMIFGLLIMNMSVYFIRRRQTILSE